MRTTRKQQTARFLREELSRIIREEINDPRLGFISITEVGMSYDLRVASIYISVYGTPEEQTQSMDVLDRAAGFLRGELSRQVEMRHTPELRFHKDVSLERGARVFQLLQNLPPAAGEPVPEAEVGTEAETDVETDVEVETETSEDAQAPKGGTDDQG
jgi:ribosome-binding factor A